MFSVFLIVVVNSFKMKHMTWCKWNGLHVLIPVQCFPCFRWRLGGRVLVDQVKRGCVIKKSISVAHLLYPGWGLALLEYEMWRNLVVEWVRGNVVLACMWMTAATNCRTGTCDVWLTPSRGILRHEPFVYLPSICMCIRWGTRIAWVPS